MDDYEERRTDAILGRQAGCLAAFVCAVLVLGLTTCRKMAWGYYPPDMSDLVLAVALALSAGLIVRLAVKWIVDRRRGD